MTNEQPVLFPSDPVPAKAYVREQLGRIEPRIRRAIVDAFAMLRQIAAVDSTVVDALEYMHTRAKLMNSLVVARVRREFAGVDGTKVKDDNGFLELRVNDLIDLRFKLVDEDGRSCNAKTDAQQRYRNQLPLLGDDVLDTIRLKVGWRWNATATDLLDIVVAFEKGDEPAWLYSILDDAGEADTVISLPRPGDSPKPARVRVRARKSLANAKRS